MEHEDRESDGSRREKEADALRAKIEAVQPRVTRKDLLARRRLKEKANAATRQ